MSEGTDAMSDEKRTELHWFADRVETAASIRSNRLDPETWHVYVTVREGRALIAETARLTAERDAALAALAEAALLAGTGAANYCRQENIATGRQLKVFRCPRHECSACDCRRILDATAADISAAGQRVIAEAEERGHVRVLAILETEAARKRALATEKIDDVRGLDPREAEPYRSLMAQAGALDAVLRIALDRSRP